MHGRSLRFASCIILISLVPGLVFAASEQELQAESETFQKLVEYLASKPLAGRGTGTPGEDKARDWLVQQFRKAGLKPALGDSYIQPFQIRSGRSVKSQSLAYRIGQGRWIQLQPGKDFAAMGLSASGRFSAAVKFAGYGIEATKREFNSYAGLGSEGQAGGVVVVFRYEPHDKAGQSRWTRQKGEWTKHSHLQTKVARAQQRAAKAVLVINPPARNDAPFNGRWAPGTAGIPAYHVSLDAFKAMLAAAGYDADKKIAALKASADRADGVVELDKLQIAGAVISEARQLDAENVIGLLPGAGKLSGEVIVLGAHYDHLGMRGEKMYPGADDNASGTAGLVLLARRLAKARAQEDQADRRSILFAAFSGEELGLLGSRHLLGNLGKLQMDRKQIVAMINLDMIGRSRLNVVTVSGVGTSASWPKLLSQAGRSIDLRVIRVPVTGPHSDHWPFVQAKIPALFFNTGFHGDLHAPGDLPEKIKSIPAVRVVRLVENLTRHLAFGEERIAFAEESGRRPRGYLGIRANTVDQGARITDVVENSPAAKAGLTAGDVITAMNDKEIDTVAVLAAMLRQAEPDSRVKLRVLREAEQMDIHVRLVSRRDR